MKSRKRKPKDKPVIHDQWIEIRTKNGRAVTTFYPPNEKFEKERLELDPPATLVYRRFNFVGPVPGEYMWTNPDLEVQMRGGLFLQRMQVADWLNVLAHERRNGHLIATQCENPVRRPEAFGPCPCRDCTLEREQLEA